MEQPYQNKCIYMCILTCIHLFMYAQIFLYTTTRIKTQLRVRQSRPAGSWVSLPWPQNIKKEIQKNKLKPFIFCAYRLHESTYSGKQQKADIAFKPGYVIRKPLIQRHLLNCYIAKNECRETDFHKERWTEMHSVAADQTSFTFLDTSLK